MFCAYDGKSDSRIVFGLLASIIDVYVQHVGSLVIHNVESWGCPHDLLHGFNTFLVVDEFASSIWSEHDHRAVATALVHRQNCAFCVSDFKIDVHGATFSLGERNIALDAIML